MKTPKKPNRKDADLTAAAKAFALAFSNAAAAQTPLTGLTPGSGMSLGAAGIVEITDDIAKTVATLRARAMKILGTKAGHERAMDQTLFKVAHQSTLEKKGVDAMATALIDAVFDQSLVTYEYVAPNQLFRFNGGTKNIEIGNVRAMLTSDLQTERQAAYPNGKVTLIPGEEFSMSLHGGSASITLSPICWAVSVDAIAENVEEEAKWLIDVAVSLLRLCHSQWEGLPPVIGNSEPHPIQKPIRQNQGIKIQGPKVLAGGGVTPPWYEIDPGVEATVAAAEFKTKAAAIFSPTKDSVAARVSQGLGWLTRGRQSADRAERLLYFFTAIEALLSGTDKTAPVVQTIARHAAVMLSNDNADRERHASRLKTLYSLRSALVHNGTRSVDWTTANSAQEYAEALFYVALDKVSLTGRHDSFSNDLAKASYGLAWPTAP
ncbi:hypothetical protein ATER59S_00052 [Aquamicrobium terrae]